MLVKFCELLPLFIATMQIGDVTIDGEANTLQSCEVSKRSKLIWNETSPIAT